MIELVQMKAKDILSLKRKLWEMNDGKCPLLGIDVPLEKTALDHIHKLKSEECSEQKGTIRNAIEFRANALEGKIVNNWKRYFGADESQHPISLPNFLRNLADYLEAGSYNELDGEITKYFVHPSEKPSEPTVSKKNYNKLVKMLRENNENVIEYPKSCKLTNGLRALFEKYHISPYN